MEAEEHLRLGQLDEALALVQSRIRSRPGDAALRTFLFQLLGAMGQWDRALQQLEVLSTLGHHELLFARNHQPVIQAELMRQEIFAGKCTPLLFGEPEPWMGFLLEANRLFAKGEHPAAAELRARAFDDAPATPGKVNGTTFAWVADADARLGPMIEVMLDGRYFWVPLSRIRRLELEPPKHLRDLLWAPAKFVWANEGAAGGLVFVRYPGTELVSDGALRLGRRTEWAEEHGLSVGRGQRLLATDTEDFPLLEVRTLELEPPE